MVIDPQHEVTLIEALRHLTEAKSLIYQISDEIGEDGGKRERLTQGALTSMAKRISSARKEGEKLIRRRPDFRLEDDPFRLPQPKLAPWSASRSASMRPRRLPGRPRSARWPKPRPGLASGVFPRQRSLPPYNWNRADGVRTLFIAGASRGIWLAIGLKDARKARTSPLPPRLRNLIPSYRARSTRPRKRSRKPAARR